MVGTETLNLVILVRFQVRQKISPLIFYGLDSNERRVGGKAAGFPPCRKLFETEGFENAAEYTASSKIPSPATTRGRKPVPDGSIFYITIRVKAKAPAIMSSATMFKIVSICVKTVSDSAALISAGNAALSAERMPLALS